MDLFEDFATLRARFFTRSGGVAGTVYNAATATSITSAAAANLAVGSWL